MHLFIAQLMTSLADWDGICDHFSDVPWEDINLVLLLLVLNFVNGSR